MSIELQEGTVVLIKGGHRLNPNPSDCVGRSFFAEEFHEFIERLENGDRGMPGFLKNFIVAFHDPEEDTKDDDVSFIDEEKYWEAFGTAIQEYLWCNGAGRVELYLSESYTTLPVPTNTEEEEGGVDVSIVVLQKSFASSKQMEMFNAVYQALQNSKVGVIILSCTLFISEPSMIIDANLFEFITFLNENNLWKDHLEIVCLKHRARAKVFGATQLKSASPDGGCRSLCGSMECGHMCDLKCHPEDRNHELSLCKLPCLRLCPQGHPCKKLCYENCGKCDTIIPVDPQCEHENIDDDRVCYKYGEKCQKEVKRFLPCGHSCIMKCSDNPDQMKCTKTFSHVLPCGHGNVWKCGQNPRNAPCQAPIKLKLTCGHFLTLNCWEHCMYGDNIECKDICKVSLPCGHVCGRECHSEDHSELKCLSECNRDCLRGIHECQRKHYCGDPCEPCLANYQHRLSCGHIVNMTCSSADPDENIYKCKNPCQRKLAFCDHLCTKLCYEECGQCEVTTYRRIPTCPWNHTVFVNCQDDLSTFKCNLKVKAEVVSACGHEVLVECHESKTISPAQAAERCTEKCLVIFNGEGECGHRCSGKCSTCFQGRFHLRCRQPCNIDLICGHSCRFPCNMVCPPCMESTCIKFCEHQSCPTGCGVPCVWKCNEPCKYECAHSKCAKKCSEVCDKTPCYKPCPKLLKCGHPCVGLCGEECPPDCRICDPSKLLQGIFSGTDEVSPSDRFIHLENCKHSIEVEGFESWLKSRINGDEILPIQCPICRTRINWLRRYSGIMKENLNLINSVRFKVFGDAKAIEEICEAVKQKLYSAEVNEALMECMGNVFGEIEILRKRQQYRANLQLAKFLEWICNELLQANKLMSVITRDLEDYPDRVKEYENLWISYFNFFVNRHWPLHPNEMKALSLEKKRIEFARNLFFRYSRSQSAKTKDLLHNLQGQRMVDELRCILFSLDPFTPEKQESCRQKFSQFDEFLKSTLAVSDMERVEIVNAFGGTAGRWFKCPNGHIYVITECGGVTEVAECSECGALIGGENHVLVQRNYLAPEMDGASTPLYPTVLNRREQ